MPGHAAAQLMGQPPYHLWYSLAESQLKLFSGDRVQRVGNNVVSCTMLTSVGGKKRSSRHENSAKVESTHVLLHLVDNAALSSPPRW